VTRQVRFLWSKWKLTTTDSLNTTMRYARADLDLKRQALSQVFPAILAPPRAGHVLFDPDGLSSWLRRL